MSKSIGIWVCIKVRILTESPWKWIRLSQSFSVITDHFLLGTVLHIPVVLHVSCAALPCRSSIVCLCLFVPTPFPFQDNNEMLKTLCLSSLKTFRERWSTLEYLKKKKFLSTWAIYHNSVFEVPWSLLWLPEINFIEAGASKTPIAWHNIQRNTIDFHKKVWSSSIDGSCSKKFKIFLSYT